MKNVLLATADRHTGAKAEPYFFLFLVLIAVAGVVWQIASTPPPPEATPTPPEPERYESPEFRAARLDYIQKCLNLGVASKVDWGPQPCVWVSPTFYFLPFDEKQTFVGAVYAHCYDGSNAFDEVILRDKFSGKQIGHYSLWSRGLKMK